MTVNDPEAGPDRIDSRGLPAGSVRSGREYRRTLVAAALSVGLVAVAAAVGLIAGHGSAGEPRALDRPPPETARQARDETRREVAASTFREGYRQGRISGTRHGRMAGRRLGRLRARVVIAQQELASAQADAAAAQSELSGMTAAPPTP